MMTFKKAYSCHGIELFGGTDYINICMLNILSADLRYATKKMQSGLFVFPMKTFGLHLETYEKFNKTLQKYIVQQWLYSGCGCQFCHMNFELWL